MLIFGRHGVNTCVAISQTLEQVAEEYQGKVTITKINVDENTNVPALRSSFDPYLALFKDGESLIL